jgi:glycosyltransferase involved in cell wall biosynthesis
MAWQRSGGMLVVGSMRQAGAQAHAGSRTLDVEPAVAAGARFAMKTAGAQSRPRVLIMRSCRLAQFVAAVHLARARNPFAEIVALSHPGYAEALHAAGAERVIELSGTRFGLLRTAPWTLTRLRAEQFDEVIVPQMTAPPEPHRNLYRLAAAIQPRRAVILPGDEAPLVIDGARLPGFALFHSIKGLLERWDVPCFLAMLAAACLVRRRPTERTGDGRLRVLHIISSLGVGGAQVQLAQLINRTPPEEYDVELLVLGGSDGDFSKRWLTRGDVKVSYVSQWPRLALSVREISERCRAGGYDIVHTWLFMANMAGAAAARLAGIPLVIASVRNLSVWKREGWYRKWWHRLGDALGSRAADVVTVNANALVDDHARWAWMPPSEIEVIHNGLDPGDLTWRRADARQRLLETINAPFGATIVGTVGRLAFEKDQETFLDILARVRTQRDDVHGVLIGDGERRAALQMRAEALGLSGAVTFLGRREDARQLAAGFDLFLLTSRSEGFPNVLLEATFLGVPCVATDIAGNPDVLHSEESLFPAGDAERGAERVLQALNNLPVTLERTASVRARALKMFTAEHSVNAWLNLYRRHAVAKSVTGARRPNADAKAA